MWSIPVLNVRQNWHRELRLTAVFENCGKTRPQRNESDQNIKNKKFQHRGNKERMLV